MDNYARDGRSYTDMRPSDVQLIPSHSMTFVPSIQGFLSTSLLYVYLPSRFELSHGKDHL